MRFRKITSAFYFFALGANVATGVVVIFLAGLRQADLAAFHERWGLPEGLFTALGWLKEDSWFFLPFFVAATGALGLLRKFLGSPWLWDVVHVVLDQLRRAAFQVDESGPAHHHRVTLFKHVQWLWRFRRWPWSGWLVAVERSGHTARKGVTYFKAPDGADDAEGIAGRAWAASGTCSVSGLPAITSESTDDDVRLYAQNTAMREAEVRKKCPKPRSLCGFPIEVSGRRWGVIVLDSRSPDPITKLGHDMFGPMGKTLAKILEKL